RLWALHQQRPDNRKSGRDSRAKATQGHEEDTGTGTKRGTAAEDWKETTGGADGTRAGTDPHNTGSKGPATTTGKQRHRRASNPDNSGQRPRKTRNNLNAYTAAGGIMTAPPAGTEAAEEEEDNQRC